MVENIVHGQKSFPPIAITIDSASVDINSGDGSFFIATVPSPTNIDLISNVNIQDGTSIKMYIPVDATIRSAQSANGVYRPIIFGATSISVSDPRIFTFTYYNGNWYLDNDRPT